MNGQRNWQPAFWSVLVLLVLLVVSNVFYMYILRKNTLEFAAINERHIRELRKIQEMCKQK